MPPWEDQCEWHRMTPMTGPDCAVMCNLIYIYIDRYIHTEWHRMTRMTGPDCAVMCNSINIHTYIHTYALYELFVLICKLNMSWFNAVR